MCKLRPWSMSIMSIEKPPQHLRFLSQAMAGERAKGVKGKKVILQGPRNSSQYLSKIKARATDSGIKQGTVVLAQ